MIVARALLIGSLAATVVVPAIARAQPAAPVDKAKAKTAKQYVDAGLAAQNSGDYETAVSMYEKAYALVPHPVLLFNMAQAHRLAKHDDKALELYDKYLAADPSGAQAKTAREFATDLRAKRDAADKAISDAKAAAAANAAEAAKAADEKRAADAKAAEAARQASVAQRTAGPSSTPGQPSDEGVEHPGRTLRIAGIGVGAVGVIGVGVGIVFGLKARSLADDLSAPGAMFDPGKVDDGKSANRTAIIGLVGGTVLVAVGVTLYWRGSVAKSRAEQVTLAPMVSDQVAGLAISGLLP